jgi:chemotaxis protein CheZ
MSAQRKVFRIESLQRNIAGDEAGFANDNPGDDLAAARHREIMDALRNLGISGPVTSAPGADEAKSILDEVKRDLGEAAKLKHELSEIYGIIDDTKKEIATLHTTGFKGAEMSRVTDELDAIVVGTEQATETILTAAEEIDQNTSTLIAKLDNEADQGLADDIQAQVVKVFEACNFQDLTGQRITKVISAFRFIEERVGNMMNIWGGIDSFADIELDDVDQPTGDAALLHGPSLEADEDLAEQDDIDALFD